MKRRFTVAAFLVTGLLSSQALLGATNGGVRGRVVMNLQGLEGIPLTLVNVATGQSFSVRTAKDGTYSVSLPGGSYVVSSSGVSGLSIGRAPLVIQVTSGRFASANIEMAKSLFQDVTNRGTSVFHNPIACVASDEFPVFDITFQPAGSVVSARLYFKSNLSDEWFYTEFQTLSGDFPKYKWTMALDPANPGATTQGDDIRRQFVGLNEPVPVDPGVPPTHRAFLPKIKEGSGIVEVTYYIQMTLVDFTEGRTREIVTKVQKKGEACKGFAAPVGVPSQGLTVLTSGGLAGAPTGFAGIGLGLATDVIGTAIGLGTVAVAEGTVITDSTPPVTSTPTPTPTPTPAPTPTPTPAPTPTPTPTPVPPTATPTPTPTPTPVPPTPTPSPSSCQVQVSVNPPGGVFNPCQATVSTGSSITTVTSSQAFIVACSATVNVTAILGPPASFVGPPAASWSGACTGNAIGNPCILSPTLPAISTVVLECGCTSGCGPQTIRTR